MISQSFDRTLTKRILQRQNGTRTQGPAVQTGKEPSTQATKVRKKEVLRQISLMVGRLGGKWVHSQACFKHCFDGSEN